MKYLKTLLIVMTLICLLDMPYGYYQLYRVIAMGIFFYLAYVEQNKKEWMFIWLFSGLLVQPFLKVALGRNIWNIIDIIWAVILFVSIIRRNKYQF